jgi:hypothetical protein
MKYNPDENFADNVDCPKVRVGKFTIRRFDDRRVWIKVEGGEGGSFPDQEFEEAIADFFEGNF